MSVLGTTSPDPFGVMLGTGYSRFVSPTGLEGLAKATGDRLDVLAVINPTNERGRFRAFITAAKGEFKTICVWHIDNPIVHSALIRYGFTTDVRIDQFNDVMTGLRWDMPEGTPQINPEYLKSLKRTKNGLIPPIGAYQSINIDPPK